MSDEKPVLRTTVELSDPNDEGDRQTGLWFDDEDGWEIGDPVVVLLQTDYDALRAALAVEQAATARMVKAIDGIDDYLQHKAACKYVDGTCTCDLRHWCSRMRMAFYPQDRPGRPAALPQPTGAGEPSEEQRLMKRHGELASELFTVRERLDAITQAKMDAAPPSTDGGR